MKYCIVASDIIPEQLAIMTLFDLLGDPTLWKENHEVVLLGTCKWTGDIEEHVSSSSDDPDFLNAEWIVLGPTDEETVIEATRHGAKYLALDDGLVELAIEEDTEVPTVPDMDTAEVEEKPRPPKQENKEEKQMAEVIDIAEVPAVPKRGRRTPKMETETPAQTATRKRHPAGKKVETLDEAVDQAIEVTKPEPSEKEGGFHAMETRYEEGYVDGMVDGDRLAKVEGKVVEGEMVTFTFDQDIKSHLIEIIRLSIKDMDEAELWDVAASIRQFATRK